MSFQFKNMKIRHGSNYIFNISILNNIIEKNQANMGGLFNLNLSKLEYYEIDFIKDGLYKVKILKNKIYKNNTQLGN